MPEKYLVKKEDGTVDHEATALKVGAAHAALEKRMGAGEAPPKSPDDYAPELPQGWGADRLKADPLFAGFLKGAHAKGLNNAQVSWALNEFQTRMDMMRSPEAGEAELVHRMGLPADQLHNQVYVPAFRAAKAFAADDAMMQRLDAKFGSDADYLQLMARIGKELGEDKPVHNGITANEADTLDDLIKHPAYNDSKHPEHAKVTRQVAALYEKKYAGQ